MDLSQELPSLLWIDLEDEDSIRVVAEYEIFLAPTAYFLVTDPAFALRLQVRSLSYPPIESGISRPHLKKQIRQVC